MFITVAQSIKPNSQLFLVDIKSFIDSTQLSSSIKKGSKIFVILSLDSKLWEIGVAGTDWLVILLDSTWHDST